MSDARYDVLGIGSAIVGGRPTNQESMAALHHEMISHV